MQKTTLKLTMEKDKKKKEAPSHQKLLANEINLIYTLTLKGL